jgi:hypothetical protein
VKAAADISPYRSAPPVRPDPYLLAWAKLRRSRRTIVGVAAGVMNVVAATCAFVVWSQSHAARILALGVVLVAAAAYRLAFRGAASFRCPRCRRAFFPANARLFDLAIDDCGHCGIAVGTPAQRPSGTGRSSQWTSQSR